MVLKGKSDLKTLLKKNVKIRKEKTPLKLWTLIMGLEGESEWRHFPTASHSV